MQLYLDPITSGGLLKMPKIIQDLTDLHKSQLVEDQIETSNSNYTKHTLHIIDELLRQEISWKELPDEEKRFLTSSDLLYEVRSLFGLISGLGSNAVSIVTHYFGNCIGTKLFLTLSPSGTVTGM